MGQLLFGIILGVIIVLTSLFSGLYVNKRSVKLAGNQQPRKLTAAQREQFLSMLSAVPTGTINVSAIVGDFESVAFAKELDSLLNMAGWHTQGVSQAVFTGNPTGLILTVNSTKETPPYASALQQTFKAIGWPALAEIHGENPTQSLNLTVGHIPDLSR